MTFPPHFMEMPDWVHGGRMNPEPPGLRTAASVSIATVGGNGLIPGAAETAEDGEYGDSRRCQESRKYGNARTWLRRQDLDNSREFMSNFDALSLSNTKVTSRWSCNIVAGSSVRTGL